MSTPATTPSSAPPRPLTGRVAIVTGSTQGLGLAIARRLAAGGSQVLLHGLATASEMTSARTEIEHAHGVRTAFSDANLNDPRAIEAMVRSVERDLGPCDILVNNAVVRHEAPVEDFGAAPWDAAMAVNLSAAFHTTRLTVAGMKQRGWGRIVNVSSVYGLVGAANRVGYVTTKTALIGLTRAVALETVTSGVTCNAVCPGTVETPVHTATVERLAAAQGLSRDDAAAQFLARKQPTGRFIGAGGVAALVAFLCGPDGADITGAALPVDGGWSIV
jgi:3-hydroxybutyrate dehydrogenase